MDKKIDYMCKVCGSTDIFWDAEAYWNTETQRFEMNNVPTFSTTFCGECDTCSEVQGSHIKKITVAPTAYSFRKGDGDD